MPKRTRLSPNHSTALPRQLVFIDCESNDSFHGNHPLQRHMLWFGVMWGGRLEGSGSDLRLTRKWEHIFFERERFWFHLDQECRADGVTWVFAHNAGFDFTLVGLMEQIKCGHLRPFYPGERRNHRTGQQIVDGMLLIEAPPFAVAVQSQHGQRYYLLDTLNYWRVPLAKLGDYVGLEKLDMPPRSAPFSVWREYCRRDVEIVQRAILKLLAWWDGHNLGQFRFTAPGLSMSAYRHRFMKEPIDFHDDWQVRKLERDSYFSGQTECYRLGRFEGLFYQLDVNSLYPAVMAAGLYPAHLVRAGAEGMRARPEPPAPPHATIAEVELECGPETFPLRTSRGVVYAAGRGVTTLAGPELAFAVAKGYVRRWGRWAQYHLRDLFSEFVAYFWGMKREYEVSGRTLERSLVKLILNSLYGKFGQRGGQWSYDPHKLPTYDFGIFWEKSPLGREFQKCLAFWDRVLVQDRSREVAKASPAVAAFVTSAARQRMRELRSVAGSRSVYYQATDSLIVDHEGRMRLWDSGEIGHCELGKLREEVVSPRVHIHGLNWYTIGDKTVCGGRKRSAEILDESSWVELQFESFERILAGGGQPKVDIRSVPKHKRPDYWRGAVDDDGWIVPLSFAGAIASAAALDSVPVVR